jgi:hypothetical protein
VPARPASITVVAGFLFLATAIALVVGFSVFFPNPLLDQLWRLNPSGAALFRSIGRLSGVFLLALACGTLAAGFGLLRGRKWAWWFAVTLFAIDSAGNLLSYFLIHDPFRTIIGAIISLNFLCLLVRRKVRAYMGVAA